jgi:hypothetical protein
MSPQILILPKSSPNKYRLLGHGHNFQKNIGPVEDSMYGAKTTYSTVLNQYMLFDMISRALL